MTRSDCRQILPTNSDDIFATVKKIQTVQLAQSNDGCENRHF